MHVCVKKGGGEGGGQGGCNKGAFIYNLLSLAKPDWLATKKQNWTILGSHLLLVTVGGFL